MRREKTQESSTLGVMAKPLPAGTSREKKEAGLAAGVRARGDALPVGRRFLYPAGGQTIREELAVVSR